MGGTNMDKQHCHHNSHILAPFNPTCSEARKVALRLLDLQTDDIVFDLGCGDGRFLEDACRLIPGLSCVGIEMDPIYFHRAQQNVQLLREELQGQQLQSLSTHCYHQHPFRNIDLRMGDVLNDNVSDPPDGLSLTEDATAIFLYLLPKGLMQIRPILETIWRKRMMMSTNHPRKRFRIVSYMFRIPDWHDEPTSVDRETKGGCPIYLYDTCPRTT
jgi:SAM-dependent methyltransferase